MTTDQAIERVCDEIKTLLLRKNQSYGNSALEPIRVFSQASEIDGILVRIDDKLSRIKNMGISDLAEDTVKDLIGYLVLLKVHQMKEQNTYNTDKIKYTYEGSY